MIYIFLADGFEEIEAMAIVDILRRAGLEVKTVGVTGKLITGNHGIPVTADITESEAVTDGLTAVMLPGGGEGTRRLDKSETVEKFLRYAAEKNLLIGAICAAPSVLGHKGRLKGKNATCFPGWEQELTGATVLPDAVVRDGNIITGKGAGVSLEFAFALVAALASPERADKVKKDMQCQ